MKLSGGCLCGFIRFTAINPSSPHSCSCDMCQKHTGCQTAVWIEFDSADVEWTAEGGNHRCSAHQQLHPGHFAPGVGPRLVLLMTLR